MKEVTPQLVLDDILNYIPKFQNEIFVIYISGHILKEGDLNQIIRQVSILSSLGIRLIIVHGSKPQITESALKHKIDFKEIDNVRITSPRLLEIVRYQSLKLSHKILERFSDIKKTGIRIKPVIGNFIKGKSLGVINGTDYASTGEVDKVHKKNIYSLLDAGFLPIISSLGIDAAGNLFNIRAVEIAAKVAIQLKAIKILYLIEEDLSWISSGKAANFTSKNRKNTDANHNTFTELNPSKLQNLVEKMNVKKAITELQQARLNSAIEACTNGVERVHFINGLLPNSILNEIFTQTGQGLLITKDQYTQVRRAEPRDVSVIVDMLNRANSMGEFREISQEDIASNINDYWVFEIDEKVCASGAFHEFTSHSMAEIGSLVVDTGYKDHGIGKNLIQFFSTLGAERGLEKIIACTTRAEQFFKELGFVEEAKGNIPDFILLRKLSMRKSKVLIKTLKKK